ncbi:2772_t:CDS:10, partial [Paraglomus occultum]
MRIAKGCLEKLRFPGYWANTSKPNLESFLKYRRKMCPDVTLKKDAEHRKYIEDLKVINEHYGFSNVCISKALNVSEAEMKSDAVNAFWNEEAEITQIRMLELAGARDMLELGNGHLKKSAEVAQERQEEVLESLSKSSVNWEQKRMRHVSNSIPIDSPNNSFITPVRSSKRKIEDDSNSDSSKDDYEYTVNRRHLNRRGKRILRYDEESEEEVIELDPSASKKSFVENYNQMKNELKWTLKSTGRVVEDVLYENISDFMSEHLVHSFTIDVDDPIIQEIFSSIELEEIELTNVKEEPDLSSELYKHLAKYYDKTTVKGIREVLNETDLNGSDFEIDTLTYSIFSLVRQYERVPNAFSLNQYEAWYNVNVWGPIVDRVYDDIPNVNVVRGDASSLASSHRKNRHRTLDTRKNIGRKGDAIIRKCSGGIKLEFGGAEAGRHYEGQNGTKWLKESGLKLPKMMRDMFVGLCDDTHCKWGMEKMKSMETIGYIHGGSALMIMTLDLPAGYITRLSKSELYYIPDNISSFSKAIELITAVWKSKMRVVRTMKTLQRDEEDSVSRLRNISSRKQSNYINRHINKAVKVLPDNQKTPNYWARDPSSWGDVVDWDIYFIKKMPSAGFVKLRPGHSSRHTSGSRGHEKALMLHTSLKVSILFVSFRKFPTDGLVKTCPATASLPGWENAHVTMLGILDHSCDCVSNDFIAEGKHALLPEVGGVFVFSDYWAQSTSEREEIKTVSLENVSKEWAMDMSVQDSYDSSDITEER